MSDNINNNLNLFKELSKITGLKNYTFRNMMYLLYHGYIHEIACESLDSEDRIKTVKISIFCIGDLTLDVSDVNNIKIISFDLLDQFKEDIRNAIVEGTSPLAEDITEKFIANIKDRYEKYI